MTYKETQEVKRLILTSIVSMIIGAGVMKFLIGV